MINRRTTLKFMAATAAVGTVSGSAAAAVASQGITWRITTQRTRWQSGPPLSFTAANPNLFENAFSVKIDAPAQRIDGFGGAVGERGWSALNLLPESVRNDAMRALFSDDGAALTLIRTPIGANDLSLRWYSYDETDGDFSLSHFDIGNDRKTLIPFIKAAQQIRPELKLWASPWSPPSWMKTNHYYSMAPAWPGQPSNGIRPDQVGREGVDAFIQEDRYFDAYARYFRRYIEDYGREGIRIGMVMPQNEFNSAQPFPSCTWTPEGLARFIPFLGREMAKTSTEIMFGTLERPNVELLEKVLSDARAAPFIKGVGVQWAGKDALPLIKARFPDLPLWGSEQECGFGTNDWHYARYSWQQMKAWFNNGARAWHYWNLALTDHGASGWGWPQNALVAVQPGGRFMLTNDYWVLRHLSAYVRPGGRFIPTPSFTGFNNQLAFRNPDGTLVVVMQNDTSDPLRINMAIGEHQLSALLPADSFNTITVPSTMLQA